MDEGKSESLLLAGRAEMTGGFHPLLLWRDRKRILARPEIAAQPNPPLANAPVRFALALGLTPLLLVAGLAGALVDVLPGERPERVGIEYRSETVIEAIAPRLPDIEPARAHVLARSMRQRDMVPAARDLAREARGLAYFEPMLPAAERRARLEAWASRLRASDIPRPQQDVLLAQMLDSAYDTRHGNRLFAAITRSLFEGGPLLQSSIVLGLILSAWLFGQLLHGDARFRHARRADRFYLYYGTSRLFWFLPAQAVAYGAISFGSASANGLALQLGQVVWLGLVLGSLIYLLGGAGEMARALAGDDAPPRDGAWAVGWRVLVAIGVATLLVMFAFALLASAISLGSAALG